MASEIGDLKQRNIYILLIIIFLGIFIALGLAGILSALLGATIIYVLLRPLNLYLQENRKWNKNASTAVLLFLSFACLIAPLFFLVKMIANRVIYYLNTPEITQEILKNIDKFATEQLNEPDLIAEIVETLKSASAEIFSSVVNGAANTFIQVIVMYFILYFTMKHFRQFEKGLIRHMPFNKLNAVKIGSELRNMTYSNILGQGLIAMIQGTLLAIGFLIFGFPEAVFWGVIGTFLSMIPMFGAPLIFVPAGLIAISNGSTLQGLGIIIYGYLIVTTIDNFIRMALGRKIANTHPIITIIGVVIGIPIFGILGILFGPLMLSLFIILVNIYNTNRSEIAEMEEIKTEE